MELSSLRAGTVIDRYVVERAIGEGGMATVLLVRHSLLGSVHALKVLTLSSRSIRERMEQEGRLQAGLSHPNIVAVTDVIDLGGAPGLIMEYVDGPTLDELIGRGPLPLEQADQLALGVLAGVAAAHRHGLVHRDLKPANVLLKPVDGAWVPKVADFGLAKVLGSVDSGGGRTRTGSTMGTPHYMSPEQVRDAKNVGPTSDIFALGAILYELVTGRRAYDGSDLLEIFNQVATASYVPVRQRVPDLPERMERAIVAAMQVDPAARPQTVEALATIWTGGVAPWSAASLDRPRATDPLSGGSVGIQAGSPAGASAGAPLGPSGRPGSPGLAGPPGPPDVLGGRAPLAPQFAPAAAGSDPAGHTFDADTLPESLGASAPPPTGSLERSAPDAPPRSRGLPMAAVAAAAALALVGVVAGVVGVAGLGGAVFLVGRPVEASPERIEVRVPVPVPVPVEGAARDPGDGGGVATAAPPGPDEPEGVAGGGVLPIETSAGPTTALVPEVADRPEVPGPVESTASTDPLAGAEAAADGAADAAEAAGGEEAGEEAPGDPMDRPPEFGLIASDDPADRKQGITNLAKRRDDEAILSLGYLVKHEQDGSVKAMAVAAAIGRYRDRFGDVDLLERLVVHAAGQAREKDALEAVRALRDLCADPKGLGPALRHWSAAVRGAAVEALPAVAARSSDPAAAIPLLEGLAHDADPEVRARVEKVRGQLR